MSLAPLPAPTLFGAEPTKPVVIDAGLHGKLKAIAPGEDKLLIELVTGKLNEIREPDLLAAALASLPPARRRSGDTATAQVYVPASLHTWLKTLAATHGRPLYQLVEHKLWELVTH